MKREIFLFPSPLQGTAFGLVLKKYLESDASHKIILSCNSKSASCSKNIKANPDICRKCRVERALLFRLFKLDEEVYLYEVNQRVALDFANIIEVKNYEYLGVNVGLGVVSSFVSHYRRTSLESIDQSVLNKLLSHAITLIDVVSQFKDVDEVVMFNGRHAESRCIYNYFIGKTVLICLEVNKTFENKLVSREFVNKLPQNLDNLFDSVSDLKAKFELDEIKEVAVEFYKRRRTFKRSGDIIFKPQANTDFNTLELDREKDVLIFTSSNYEYASINLVDEIVPQDRAIRLIAEAYPKYRFIVRAHPNQGGTQEWTKLEHLELPNVVVIPPDAKVNSYKLLDVVKRVLVFNSTIGVEACYNGNIVVELRESIYTKFDLYPRISNIKDLGLFLESSESLSKSEFLYYIGFYFSMTWLPVETDFLQIKKDIITRYKYIGYKRIYGSHYLYQLAKYAAYRIWT